MRVLRFIFTSLIIIGGIVLLTAFLAREVLLLWGTSAVRSSLTELQSISRNSTEYVRMCRQKGTPADQVAIDRMQLRFTSSTEYVLEVLCAQFTLDPIVIRNQRLPLFVKKVPGSAGVIWGTDRSGVTLEVFGRRRSVLVEQRMISGGAGNASLGTSPVSSCAGNGFMCCQNETQSGIGESLSNVNDCPRSCYNSCVERPVVLSFSADPFPDIKTRTLVTASGESVSFSYVASYDDNKRQPVTVTIDYGDGAQDTFTTLTGEATHTYYCSGGQTCTLPVKISLQTTTGMI